MELKFWIRELVIIGCDLPSLTSRKLRLSVTHMWNTSIEVIAPAPILKGPTSTPELSTTVARASVQDEPYANGDHRKMLEVYCDLRDEDHEDQAALC